MKTTNLLMCFVLAFSVAYYAEAQEQSGEPSVEQAAEAYRQHENALIKLQNTLREKSADGQNADDEQPRNELRRLVKKAFDARQKLRYAHVRDLERRLHEIELAIQRSQQNEEVIIEARLDDLLSGEVPTAPTTYQAAVREPAAERPIDNFDIDARERLARFELEEAEEELAAAEKEFSSLRALDAEGGASARQLREAENRQRRAAIELKRAKAKIQGIASERSARTAAAEADVEQAEAEKHKADAKYQTSIAQVETAEAEIAKEEAGVAAAQAKLDFQQTQYERLKQLAETKSIEERLLDEKANELEAWKGALESARAAVVIAKKNVRQVKAAADESLAERELAEARLRAAKARRDRLKHRQGVEPSA